jgi:glycosyltransferase involved in cell wall biosynthesis
VSEGRRGARVVIANFGRARPTTLDHRAFWASHPLPPPRRRTPLFDQPLDWGFHIYSLGVRMMDLGLADRVEFWDYADPRSTVWHSSGILRVLFENEEDVAAYLERYGPPDLFVNHGGHGEPVLAMLEGRRFRVYVPALRKRPLPRVNAGAECFLVDDERDLDERSMLYVPVANLHKLQPNGRAKERDFIYLASVYRGKRHDLLLDAVRGTAFTGHLHPVEPDALDLSGTRVTTSRWGEREVADLLHGSRIAVYPADWASSPAAMWECVAAGLPIVVNETIQGGRHLVVPGVTGELVPPDSFRDGIEHVLANRRAYRPREHFEEHWDTLRILDGYIDFFRRMGWAPCS